jgi:MFS family permease
MTEPRSSPGAAASTAPDGARAWRLVALLAAICFVGHFNRVSMAVAGDMRIMSEYGISTTTMGGVYSAFLVVYTLAMIPGGWVIDRFGPRVSLALVCLGSAVFVACTGLVGWTLASAALALPALLVIRSAMGMASAPLHPASAKAVSLGVPLRLRSAANGLVTGAALLGVASTYVIFGGLVDWFDWPAAFIVAAFATAGLGLVWIRSSGAAASTKGIGSLPKGAYPLGVTKGEDPPGAETRIGSLVKGIDSPGGFETKNLLLLTLSYAAVGYFQYLFFYWMHYYFETVLSLGSAASKLYAAIPPLAMALAMPLGGWLSDRIHSAYGWQMARRGLAIVAMTASAALLLLGTRATQPLWIVVWLSLALGVLGIVEGPFWVTAVEVGGRRGGLSAAIFNTGGNAGGVLAPIATPWISDSLGFGWQTGIAAGSAVCLAGALAWCWIDPGP